MKNNHSPNWRSVSYSRHGREFPRLLTWVLALSATILGTAGGGSLAAAQTDYSRAYSWAYEVGLKAYTYGLPLLEFNKTFLTMTSINVPNTGTSYGPVNVVNNQTTLNGPGSAVVATGANALSSIAWLDLTVEPQVLHVPLVTNHFFVLALLDPYTENLVNLGSAHNTCPGDYVICGPRQRHRRIPSGTYRIDVDYTRIWIIGSTQLKGTNDLANVNKIQQGYTLTPLSKYGTNYQPPYPAHPVTTPTNSVLPTGLQFFDSLGQLLKDFPPPPEDFEALCEFATVGIGPGLMPSHDRCLSAETLRGLQDAVSAGPTQIVSEAKSLFLASATNHDGYFLGGFGRYGKNYKLRAVVSQVGLGAFTPEQAIYAMAWTDYDLQSLNGATNYVLHMPLPPPVDEGWTLTVYGLNGEMVPNSINRYQISNSSTLVSNLDGSVDIYLQAAPPDTSLENNWLPTPDGAGFEVMWRLLAPKPVEIESVLDGSGWQPPAIYPFQ
jgi:hypothetical protein